VILFIRMTGELDEHEKRTEDYMQQILKKYEYDQDSIDEMRILLNEFVKFMNHEEIVEILKDYHIEL